MHEVRQWPDSLGLGQYAEAFEENAIEWESLGVLDHDVLKDMGIAAAGHRLRILKAARGLTHEGAPVPAAAPFAPSATPESSAPDGEAERRQLRVISCHLVGSTALPQRLDPEELREIMRAFQDRCAGAISRFGGFIARYMGDGLPVYFGYPQAFEDAPGRSVRAGPDIVAAMTELQREVGDSRGVTLSVPVGIATGLVVVGDIVGEGASAESAVIGETPNLAARVQGEAQADQVVVADATRERPGDRFQFQDLGARTVKGIAEPARIWRAADMRTWYPAFSVALMEAYAGAGRVEDGTAVVARETARVAETGENAWDAEFHRVRGGLLCLEEGRTAKAETCCQDGLRVARAQHARSFELRAATGLSRLWQRQDRTDEARALLRPVHESCSEGPAIPDLVEAHRLLEGLGMSIES